MANEWRSRANNLRPVKHCELFFAMSSVWGVTVNSTPGTILPRTIFLVQRFVEKLFLGRIVLGEELSLERIVPWKNCSGKMSLGKNCSGTNCPDPQCELQIFLINCWAPNISQGYYWLLGPYYYLVCSRTPMVSNSCVNASKHFESFRLENVKFFTNFSSWPC